MMNIESLKSPIDDKEVIRKLIDAYSRSYQGWGGFYNKLVTFTNKKYTSGEHYQKDKDEFDATMFNAWKKNILEVTQEKYISLYRKGILGSDFPILRNYLKTISDVPY